MSCLREHFVSHVHVYTHSSTIVELGGFTVLRLEGGGSSSNRQRSSHLALLYSRLSAALDAHFCNLRVDFYFSA